ncbi:MAG TPA: hypothetical protein VMT63_14325 [Bacteroidales bacterium]|nr:hypothetical protein [Bacteroidales bacterium]
MQKIANILRSTLLLLFLVALTTTGCAVKKNPWQKKKSQASRVNASQLGRNKYYFSTGYQKRLQKSVKKK